MKTNDNITISALWKLNVVTSLVLGVTAILSVWAVIPHRVGTVEDRLTELERTQSQWIELLIRIDERVERMAAEQERIRESQRERPEP